MPQSKKQGALRVADRRLSPRVVEDHADVAATMADPRFRSYCALFETGALGLYVEPGGPPPGGAIGWTEWTKIAASRRVAVRTALAAHLVAGDRGHEGEAVSLEGYERHRVRAVALSYRDDAMTSCMRIGLQDAPNYRVAEVVGRLVQRVGPGGLMVTSAGGREGCYDCHVRVPEMAFLEARALLSTLLEGIGFEPRRGVVEILPTAAPGRLPFGLRGRELFGLFNDWGMEFGTEWCWQALVECHEDLVPLDYAQPRPAGPRPGGGAAPRAAVKVTRAEADRARVSRVLQDPAFAAYTRLVADGAAVVFVQPDGPPRGETGGWPWTRASRRTPTEVAVAAHLLASQTDAPVSLAGCDVNAVGLSRRADAMTSFGTIDLDGTIEGYDPPAIVRRLAGHVGRDRLLVTSSSGRPGRFHCHVRLPTMALGEARSFLAALLREVDAAKRPGGAEIFPAPSNGRLPFGRGGCELFTDLDLEVSVGLSWQELTRLLAALPPLDVAQKFPREPNGEPGLPPSKLPRLRPATAERTPTGTGDLERWRREGVRRRERHDALISFAMDGCRRGLSAEETIASIQKWIDQGGLRRSALASKRGAIARERNVCVPRLVAVVYLHPPHEQRYANLTGKEIAFIIEVAESAFGGPGAAPGKRRGAVAPAVVLLLDVMPWFKGAWLDGHPEVPLHQEKWTCGLGRRGHGYAEIRDALGLFIRSTPYVKGERSTTWRLRSPFPFETTEPESPLVETRPQGEKKWRADWVLVKARQAAGVPWKRAKGA